MKLPTDKKERLQMLILMGIVGVGVMYAAVHFLLLPLLHSRREIPRQLEELERQISTAEQAIALVPRQLEEYNEAAGRINRLAGQYFLQPVLGSYILEAERMLGQIARQADVRIENYREDGIRHFPTPRRSRIEYRTRSYSVIVNFKADYASLLRFADMIRQHNPFITLVDLNIREQRGNPLAHDISFKIQWPVWAANQTVPQLMPEDRILYEP